MKRTKLFLLLIAMLFAIAATASCGGGGGGDGGASSGGGGGPTLSSIAVTPADSSIATGNTQQLTATGTYSDGSTQNLTSSAAWSLSNTGIATISGGLATSTGSAAGSTTITATSGGVSGSTTLKVIINLAKTGQTTSYATGDDGDLEKGVAWPSPRFTDNGNGTVKDNLTGLIWLKDANCFSARTWAQALSDANSLASGSCGLTDGSSVGNWRLPNVNELESLINAELANSAVWLNTQGFSNVQADGYWSSSTYADDPAYAWVVAMYDGLVDGDGKTSSYYVWPVRAGQ